MRRPNWTPAEDAILREHYPLGHGPEACMPGLPLRTYDSIVQRACKLKLTVKRVIVNHKPKADPAPARDMSRVAGPCLYRQFSGWGRWL